MLIFCDFIQVYVFTTNHHLNMKVFCVAAVCCIVVLFYVHGKHLWSCRTVS